MHAEKRHFIRSAYTCRCNIALLFIEIFKAVMTTALPNTMAWTIAILQGKDISREQRTRGAVRCAGVAQRWRAHAPQPETQRGEVQLFVSTVGEELDDTEAGHGDEQRRSVRLRAAPRQGVSPVRSCLARQGEGGGCRTFGRGLRTARKAISTSSDLNASLPLSASVLVKAGGGKNVVISRHSSTSFGGGGIGAAWLASPPVRPACRPPTAGVNARTGAQSGSSGRCPLAKAQRCHTQMRAVTRAALAAASAVRCAARSLGRAQARLVLNLRNNFGRFR